MSLTPVEAVVLAALAEGPQYGYSLVQRISELTDGRIQVRPGNLYRVLDRLMGEGFVTESDQPYAGEHVRRRYFRATGPGARAAADELAMYGRVLERTPSLRALTSDV